MIVDKCYFEKSWFESCNFFDIKFKGFERMLLIQTAVADSKFFKFNKSIEFKEEFFLIDILHPENQINEIFIK